MDQPCRGSINLVWGDLLLIGIVKSWGLEILLGLSVEALVEKAVSKGVHRVNYEMI